MINNHIYLIKFKNRENLFDFYSKTSWLNYLVKANNYALIDIPINSTLEFIIVRWAQTISRQGGLILEIFKISGLIKNNGLNRHFCPYLIDIFSQLLLKFQKKDKVLGIIFIKFQKQKKSFRSPFFALDLKVRDKYFCYKIFEVKIKFISLRKKIPIEFKMTNFGQNNREANFSNSFACSPIEICPESNYPEGRHPTNTHFWAALIIND